MPWALFSESTRLAFFTAVTSVDSTGLPEAAVATGTMAIAAKLPGFEASVGTAAQPAPNWSPAAIAEPDMGAIDGAGAGAAADAAGAGAAAGAVPPPQAESETVQIAAAVATANLMVRMEKPFRKGESGRSTFRRRHSSAESDPFSVSDSGPPCPGAVIGVRSGRAGWMGLDQREIPTNG